MSKNRYNMVDEKSAKRIIELDRKGIDRKMIEDILIISSGTISRVIRANEAVMKNDWNMLSTVYQESRRVVTIVLGIYGLTEDVLETVKPQTVEADPPLFSSEELSADTSCTENSAGLSNSSNELSKDTTAIIEALTKCTEKLSVELYNIHNDIRFLQQQIDDLINNK